MILQPLVTGVLNHLALKGEQKVRGGEVIYLVQVRLGAYNAHSHDSCLQYSHTRTTGLVIEVMINLHIQQTYENAVLEGRYRRMTPERD